MKLDYAPVLGVALLLAIWDAMALISPTLIPHSWSVAGALWEMVCQGDIVKDALTTLERTLAGFAIAALAGVPIGLGIGGIPLLNRALAGPLDFVRSIPAFVLLPAFLAIFRSSEGARLGIVVLGAGVVMVAHTAFGTAHVKRLRLDVGKVYGASRRFLSLIVFLETLPQIADGARIGLSLSLILAIVGEIMLGATSGLGTRVNDSLSGFNLPQLYAMIVVVGFLGYLLNLSARSLTKRYASYGRFL